MHKDFRPVWILLFLLLFCAQASAVKVETLPRIKLPSGTGDTEVSNVKAIYVGPKGEIFIGSARNNRVKVYSSNGQYLRTIPSSDDDNIDVPQDIDIGVGGSIYIVDRDRDELSKFDENGLRIGTLGGEKAFDRPMSVSVARDGKVYVADKDKETVRIFDPSGQSLGDLQGAGYDEPIAVDVDHQGRVFVLDKKRKSVQVFNSDNEFLKEIRIAYAGKEIDEPVDLCVNQHGEVLVLDEDEKVFYFMADYETSEWSRPYGGMFDKPISIDVVGRDIVYVLDNKDEIIWKFKLSDLPSLVKEKTVKESIVKKAVISTNIDGEANVYVNRLLPDDGMVVLSVFENNRNIATGLIAENFTRLEVDGESLDVKSAEALFSSGEIDFIFILGTVKLRANEISEIREKITTEFLSKLDESRHRVAFFTCAGDAKMALPLEKSFSKQKSAVEKLEFDGDKVMLYDGILSALSYYDSLQSDTYPIFLVFTNSGDESSRNSFNTLEKYKRSHGLPQIYTLVYDDKKDAQMLEDLKKIADFSGGFFYSADKHDMIYFLFRRAVALIRGQYWLALDNLPTEGELAVDVDVDLDGNVLTETHPYSEPSGEKVDIKGKSFFEKYGLILLIVLLVIILIIIIIIIMKKVSEKSKAPIGEALLEVKSGGAPQKEYRLRKGVNKIGSANDNDIVLQVEGISGHHAIIEFAGGKYTLVDSDSTNGTYVNRNRIDRRILINNDVISIASVVDFVFKTG